MHFAIVAGLLACMAFSGTANIKHELSIMGEFSNYPQEELVEWINEKTPKGMWKQREIVAYCVVSMLEYFILSIFAIILH